MRRIAGFFLYLFLLLISGLACKALTPPTPTPTASLMPGLRPTPAPASTSPPVPTATLTPQGFYSHPEAGFSFTYPADWRVAQEDETGLVLTDAALDFVFVAGNVLADGELSFDEHLQNFMGDLASFYADIRVQSQGEVVLADGVQAPSADVSANDPQDNPVLFRVVIPKLGARVYIFVAFGPAESLDTLDAALEQLYGSVRLFTPSVYGLDRQQTLIQLGGDPDPEDLDPALAQGSADEYVGHLFSGLVRLSPQLKIEPDLAQSWVVSADGTTYTFTLRSGLVFQSGQPLTAADVQYSWERAAAPGTESPTAATYLGDILGLKDRLAGIADHIAGVEVIDDQTLRVTLDAPKPYFLAKLTYPTAYVVNRLDVENDGARWMFAPDASGPFGLREYLEGESISFVRNDAYHAPPKITYLVYLFNPRGPGLRLYEAGEIDLLYLAAEDVVRVRRPDDRLHAEWLSTTSLCTTLLQFDTSQPPMDDPDVRRAFALAVDRNALLERFSQNSGLIADAVLPPAMPGHSSDLPQVTFDPDAARAALSASQYADNLPTLVLNESGLGGEPSDFVTALVEMWRTTLEAEVQVEQFAPRDYTRSARLNHGHIVSYGWCADYPDPENFLDILFHSQSDFNVAGYDNPDVDQLLEQARTEADPARRLELYHAAENAILADGASLPLLHSVFDVLVQPYVKGFSLLPMGAPYVHRLSIENP